MERANKALDRWRRDTGLPLVIEVGISSCLWSACWLISTMQPCTLPAPNNLLLTYTFDLPSNADLSGAMGLIRRRPAGGAPLTLQSPPAAAHWRCGSLAGKQYESCFYCTTRRARSRHSDADARTPSPCSQTCLRLAWHAGGTLLERWVLHYRAMLPESPSHLTRSQISRLNPSSVYKRLVIMLRSLYTYVRILPAYKMYRACKVRAHVRACMHVCTYVREREAGWVGIV